MVLGRTLSDYTNLFFLDDYKTNEKVSINTSSLEFRLKKRDETKKFYFLEKIKHNDLMSEKYKKKYINYVYKYITSSI